MSRRRVVPVLCAIAAIVLARPAIVLYAREKVSFESSTLVILAIILVWLAVRSHGWPTRRSG